MSQTPEEQSEPPQELGITLDELTAAYAQSMDARAEPAAESEPRPEEGPSLESTTDESAESTEDGPSLPTADIGSATEAEDPHDDDPCPVSPRTILEAMLFVGNQENEPLSSARASELMRGVLPGEIPTLVDELNHRYASNGCPYRIVSDGAGYRISLDRPFYPVRNKFYGRVREARLSQAALDVLAIVAYRQPIVAEEVNRLRGIPSGHLLAQLVRRQLLRIERQPGKRRSVSYHTTIRFLELFHLESIEDLPQSEELENR
ncbi:MAG: SMC-Scp complex subunit ScpB [Planctomycetota bacterium]